MYAVFAAPHKQVKVAPGETIRIDFLTDAKEGDAIVFDKVLLYSDGFKLQVGAPFLNARVKATVLGHGRERKLVVFKKKRRVDFHKKYGHRTHYTTLRIDAIEA